MICTNAAGPNASVKPATTSARPTIWRDPIARRPATTKISLPHAAGRESALSEPALLGRVGGYRACGNGTDSRAAGSGTVSYTVLLFEADSLRNFPETLGPLTQTKRMLTCPGAAVCGNN